MSPTDDLRERFAALREEDAGEAPAFASTLVAALARQEPRGSAAWGWTALVGAAAVIAIIALALNLAGPPLSTPDAAAPLAETVEQWLAPTDALLASAGLPDSSVTVLDEPADDIAFFSSPTADLLEVIDVPTARTP